MKITSTNGQVIMNPAVSLTNGNMMIPLVNENDKIKLIPEIKQQVKSVEDKYRKNHYMEMTECFIAKKAAIAEYMRERNKNVSKIGNRESELVQTQLIKYKRLPTHNGKIRKSVSDIDKASLSDVHSSKNIKDIVRNKLHLMGTFESACNVEKQVHLCNISDNNYYRRFNCRHLPKIIQPVRSTKRLTIPQDIIFRTEQRSTISRSNSLPHNSSGYSLSNEMLNKTHSKELRIHSDRPKLPLYTNHVQSKSHIIPKQQFNLNKMNKKQELTGIYPKRVESFPLENASSTNSCIGLSNNVPTCNNINSHIELNSVRSIPKSPVVSDCVKYSSPIPNKLHHMPKQCDKISATDPQNYGTVQETHKSFVTPCAEPIVKEDNVSPYKQRIETQDYSNNLVLSEKIHNNINPLSKPTVCQQFLKDTAPLSPTVLDIIFSTAERHAVYSHAETSNMSQHNKLKETYLKPSFNVEHLSKFALLNSIKEIDLNVSCSSIDTENDFHFSPTYSQLDDLETVHIDSPFNKNKNDIIQSEIDCSLIVQGTDIKASMSNNNSINQLQWKNSLSRHLENLEIVNKDDTNHVPVSNKLDKYHQKNIKITANEHDRFKKTHHLVKQHDQRQHKANTLSVKSSIEGNLSNHDIRHSPGYNTKVQQKTKQSPAKINNMLKQDSSLINNGRFSKQRVTTHQSTMIRNLKKELNDKPAHTNKKTNGIQSTHNPFLSRCNQTTYSSLTKTDRRFLNPVLSSTFDLNKKIYTDSTQSSSPQSTFKRKQLNQNIRLREKQTDESSCIVSQQLDSCKSKHKQETTKMRTSQFSKKHHLPKKFNQISSSLTTLIDDPTCASKLHHKTLHDITNRHDISTTLQPIKPPIKDFCFQTELRMKQRLLKQRKSENHIESTQYNVPRSQHLAINNKKQLLNKLVKKQLSVVPSTEHMLSKTSHLVSPPLHTDDDFIKLTRVPCSLINSHNSQHKDEQHSVLETLKQDELPNLTHKKQRLSTITKNLSVSGIIHHPKPFVSIPDKEKYTLNHNKLTTQPNQNNTFIKVSHDVSTLCDINETVNRLASPKLCISSWGMATDPLPHFHNINTIATINQFNNQQTYLKNEQLVHDPIDLNTSISTHSMNLCFKQDSLQSDTSCNHMSQQVSQSSQCHTIPVSLVCETYTHNPTNDASLSCRSTFKQDCVVSTTDSNTTSDITKNIIHSTSMYDTESIQSPLNVYSPKLLKKKFQLDQSVQDHVTPSVSSLQFDLNKENISINAILSYDPCPKTTHQLPACSYINKSNHLFLTDDPSLVKESHCMEDSLSQSNTVLLGRTSQSLANDKIISNLESDNETISNSSSPLFH